MFFGGTVVTRFLSVLFSMAGFVAAGGVSAAVVVTAAESGSDVVITSVGTINTDVCTYLASGYGSTWSGIDPYHATIAFGVTGSIQTLCATKITAPSSFGSGQPTYTGSNSGASFYLSTGGFWGPEGLTSSTYFSGTQTYLSNTFSSMGLTTGSYVYTLSNGEVSDTVTVVVYSACNLTNLIVRDAELSPVFSSSVSKYTASLNGAAKSVIITPTAEKGASTQINGRSVRNGYAAGPYRIKPGNNIFNITVNRKPQSCTLDVIR
jgi:Cadherin-like beta sandwich domain